MATPDSIALVDTNILVEALYADTPHHDACKALLDRARDGSISLCIAPQVCAELYAVVTDARRVSNPMKPDEALDVLDRLLTFSGLTFLPTPVDVVERWMALVRTRPVTRGRIFDLQLIATMQGNSVSHIYTYNTKDFDGFDGVTILNPA